ncbi:MAG: hypothetical protein QM503_06420 [Bacteroidota bacterium]
MIEIQEEEKNTRPELLKILCILTFVGSGFSLVSNSIMFLTIDMVRGLYEQGAFDFLAEEMDTNVLEILISINASYFLFQAVLFSLTVYGAYMMWNLKKIGFHIYTVAQIILLILPQVFLPELPFPTFELIISLIFITLYAKNLNYLN